MNPQTNPSSPILPQKLQGFVLFSRHGTPGKDVHRVFRRQPQKTGWTFHWHTEGPHTSQLGLFQKEDFFNVAHAWLIWIWSNCYLWLMHRWKASLNPRKLASALFQGNRSAGKSAQEGILKAEIRRSLATQVRRQDNCTPKRYSPETGGWKNSHGRLFPPCTHTSSLIPNKWKMSFD